MILLIRDKTLHQIVDQIVSTVTLICLKGKPMNADLQAKFDTLAAKVAAEATVTQSAITLLNGLSAQVAGLKSTTTDPATIAAIDALVSAVDAQTTPLASAVTANTSVSPAAPVSSGSAAPPVEAVPPTTPPPAPEVPVTSSGTNTPPVVPDAVPPVSGSGQ